MFQFLPETILFLHFLKFFKIYKRQKKTTYKPF